MALPMQAGTTQHDAQRRTIIFERNGPNAFRGEFYVRGEQFEDVLLTSSVGRIPQDACDAVTAAQARLATGTWPESYERALDELARISDVQIWDPA